MIRRSIPPIKQDFRYKLHIELADIKPTIWREIWVEGQLSLAQLHHILQAAMGWTDAHLHEFNIRGTVYSIPHPDDDSGRKITDERRVRLAKLFEPGMQFDYIYDFGDNWRHIVRVDNGEKNDKPYGAAYVEAGARACPPEDSGGPFMYQQFLDDLLADPGSEEVQSFFKWVGPGFDPNAFDLRGTNTALLRLVRTH